MDINIKKFSGRCDRIIGLEGNLELFSYLNKIVKDDKDNDSIELFPVKLKDFFTQEVLFIFVLRCSKDNFDTILPIFYSKTNSQVLRNLIDIDFGDFSLSMKDIYKIKSVLSDSSDDEHKKVYTMYFSNDLGLHYDTFVGSKIVKLNSGDNETIVSNASFLLSLRYNLSFKESKDGSVNLDYIKKKLFESLLRNKDVNNKNFELAYNSAIMILASLASGLLPILGLKPLIVGVHGRLSYDMVKLANSFWSAPDSLELVDSKQLLSDIRALKGFSVSISDKLYCKVAGFFNRGYGLSKLDTFCSTIFHVSDSDDSFDTLHVDELYLRLDVDDFLNDIKNFDEKHYKSSDIAVRKIKTYISGFIDNYFGSYGCIGYEFLDFIYHKFNIKQKAYYCFRDENFFKFFRDELDDSVDFMLSDGLRIMINDAYESFGNDLKATYDSSGMSFDEINRCLLIMNVYCRFYLAFITKKGLDKELSVQQKELLDAYIDRYSPILLVAYILFDYDEFIQLNFLKSKLVVCLVDSLNGVLSKNDSSNEMNTLINNKEFTVIHKKFLDVVNNEDHKEWKAKHTYHDYYIFSKEELASLMYDIGVVGDKDIFTILKGWLEAKILKTNSSGPGMQLAIKKDSIVKKYYAILKTPIDDNGESHE